MTSAVGPKTSPRITVKVTQDLIDVSSQRDSSHCMIADAVAKTIPNARYISVDLATIRFTDMTAGIRYIYLTPRHAQEALIAFDQGEKVEPFSLQLRGAHVLPTGNARRARASLQPQSSPNSTNNTPPERRDGEAPPIGPLAGGAVRNRRGAKNVASAGTGNANRTGRRREFGLRGIIR